MEGEVFHLRNSAVYWLRPGKMSAKRVKMTVTT